MFKRSQIDVLELNIDGEHYVFHGPREFEFALAGRVSPPASKIAALSRLGDDELLREADAIRAVEERFQIIAGERRLRAAQMANWQSVPVQIREVSERQMAELAIVENVQRKDLNALEKASSFQRYLQEYSCTQEELAARVNIDRSTVENLIRLLELPEEVKQMVAEGQIAQGHARALLPLGDEQEQCEFAKQVCRESLSVRATEIEEQLRLALGTKVDLRQTVKGRGRITIHFKNHGEFDRLRAILCGEGESFREAT